MNEINPHEHWMRLAIAQAEEALTAGELPIGGVLIGSGHLLASSQTQVRRRESMVAHGELTALLDIKWDLYKHGRPIVLYTTLEPCLMCLGAIMQCGVDEVVFGMRCAPDGATQFVNTLAAAHQNPPKVTSGILEKECADVFSRWDMGKDHPAYNYVQSILKPYK